MANRVNLAPQTELAKFGVSILNGIDGHGELSCVFETIRHGAIRQLSDDGYGICRQSVVIHGPFDDSVGGSG